MDSVLKSSSNAKTIRFPETFPADSDPEAVNFTHYTTCITDHSTAKPPWTWLAHLVEC